MRTVTKHGEPDSLRLTPDMAPSSEMIRHLRHRLNFLINGKLRSVFDQ